MGGSSPCTTWEPVGDLPAGSYTKLSAPRSPGKRLDVDNGCPRKVKLQSSWFFHLQEWDVRLYKKSENRVVRHLTRINYQTARSHFMGVKAGDAPSNHQIHTESYCSFLQHVVSGVRSTTNVALHHLHGTWAHILLDPLSNWSLKQ